MDREAWRRLLWVASLVAVLGLCFYVLIRRGAEWGLGAAP